MGICKSGIKINSGALGSCACEVVFFFFFFLPILFAIGMGELAFLVALWFLSFLPFIAGI